MFKEGLVNPYTFTSTHLNREVKLGIYLPVQYTPLYDHQLIIAFDGQDFAQLGQLHRSYEKLILDDEIERAVIVFIHYPNIETRSKEYHPDSHDKHKMMQFVTEELLPFVDGTFATIRSGQGRLLMGDSLAASIALSLSLTYPQTFSRALLFSPMITETVHKELEQCDTRFLDLYQVIGEQENHFTLMNGDTADFLTPNRTFHDLLTKRQVNHVYKELTGGHTWKTWKPEIPAALKYFLWD